MRRITYKEAVRDAIREEMQIDEKVFLFGEDVAVHGGAFFVTTDLLKEFGPERVLDTPISEIAIVGLAIGSSILGLRPVAEIMFGDFITLIADQIINHASKFVWLYKQKLHLVIRTPMGGYRCYGATHSQSLEKLFAESHNIYFI